MSLILEALRKSEAARQLGRAPGLHTPMPGRDPRDGRRWHWLGWMALLVASGAGAAWWFMQPAPLPTAAVSAAPANDAVRAAPQAGSPDLVPPAVVPAPPAPVPIVTALPDHPQAPRATPDAAPDPAATRTAPVATTATSQPASAASSPPAALPSPLAATTAPVRASATTANATAPAPDEYLPSVWDLPPAVRGALPPLKVSMHVWAEQPQRRILIVDGQRIGEGARLADGVRVEAIRRDGAVLDLRGRRVLLPRP